MSKVQDQENIIPNNKSGQYCIDYDCTLSTFTYNEYDIIAVTAGINQIHGTFLKHLLMMTLFLFSTEGEQRRKKQQKIRILTTPSSPNTVQLFWNAT